MRNYCYKVCYKLLGKSQVYVSDDDTVVYFNIRGGKNVETEKISLEDTNSALNSLKGVQTQLPPARQAVPS